MTFVNWPSWTHLDQVFLSFVKISDPACVNDRGIGNFPLVRKSLILCVASAGLLHTSCVRYSLVDSLLNLAMAQISAFFSRSVPRSPTKRVNGLWKLGKKKTARRVDRPITHLKAALEGRYLTA